MDAMRVKGLAWLGIPAGDRFFGEPLDLEVAFDAGNTVELTAGNDDRIQVLGPRPPLLRVLPQPRRQHRPAARGRRPGSGEAELAPGGAGLPGEPESDGTWTWLTFRAPDGNIHSLGARMA
jgi:hypothetical protein